jgi:hypothetical protein
MTTPTKLDPRVFERAAAMIGKVDFCCFAINLAKGLTLAESCREKDFFKELFDPHWCASAFYEGAENNLARQIALDLCAIILRDEQRRARK